MIFLNVAFESVDVKEKEEKKKKDAEILENVVTQFFPLSDTRASRA